MSKRSTKLANILDLREKILQLRHELQCLEKVEVAEFSPVRSKNLLSREKSRERSIASNASRRRPNPESPIRDYNTNASRQSIKLEHPSSKANQKQQQIRMNRTSTTLKLDLTNLIPQQALQTRYSTMMQCKAYSPSKVRDQNYNTAPAPKASVKSLLRLDEDSIQTPRFQKVQSIKTYHIPYINPILNPPIQKIPSRKMFREKNYSPSNIYLNHSGSNPNMYFSPKNHQLLLSNKTLSNKKNVSQTIADVLVSDYPCQKSPKAKQGKRHYSRHLKESIGRLIYRS